MLKGTLLQQGICVTLVNRYPITHHCWKCSRMVRKGEMKADMREERKRWKGVEREKDVEDVRERGRETEKQRHWRLS